MQTINAAIIGLGWWGKKLVEAVQPHASALRFVHGVSKEPESVAAFANTQGLTLSTSLDEALEDPRVQAVVLATPHSLHPDQVERCARAGKHVFCEKPLALNVCDARRAVSTCEECGIVLALGHNRRFWPAMVELFRLVKSGELGRVLHLEGHFSNENSNTSAFASWRDSADEAPAGGLTSCGLHLIDAFVALAGPAESVQATLHSVRRTPTPLDTLAVSLRFEQGATGYFAVVRATPRYWRVHVFGTEASAEVVGEMNPALVLRQAGDSVRRIEFPPVDNLRLELEAFAAAVTGAAPYPIATQQMLAAAHITESIIKSVTADSTLNSPFPESQ